ncbi:MAE_28990/MAE_18760 family HEPN-like nuclease [Methylovulum miyakonense]|uniref:MAE_28990/MAE_18760 family HEPN-like nuclease n=1 Tax=Methylovulum miyakonense TaxID=645578 RepID=UPI00036335B4|nr:MAE_28990/MAE_18760 family HEPN-like nuclease [Methylovulum miyakonense]
MTETFIFSRLESIEKRFQEVDILLRFAEENQNNEEAYSTLCRSAHIILVAHFEGAIKEICRDVIDDINYNITYDKIPSKIFATYCDYFLVKENNNEFSSKGKHKLKEKLSTAFGTSRATLKVEPFIFTEGKNLAPKIIETILKRFGLDDFFWSLKNSSLDVVFQDSRTEIEELENLLQNHINGNVIRYPYTVNRGIYNPDENILTETKQKTLWEEFIDDILKERHNIVHGQVLNNPYNHEDLNKAKIKIKIVIYVFIINLAFISNPNS